MEAQRLYQLHIRYRRSLRLILDSGRGLAHIDVCGERLKWRRLSLTIVQPVRLTHYTQMKRIWGMCAGCDDEVVARNFDEAARIADFGDVDRHQLRSLRLLHVDHLLAETKLDFHFFAFLV